MKCIIYISKTLSDKKGLTVPLGLAKVYLDSRKNNAELGITSILTHKNGYYLQVLEGDDDIVNELFERIKKSSLHTDVVIILDSEIPERYFKNCPMRLIANIQTDSSYLSLASDLKSKMEALPNEKRSLLKIFNSQVVIESTNKNIITTERIGLKKWPSFNKIAPTPTTLELCAKLVGKKLSREEIYTPDMSPEQITEYDDLIAEFKSMGLLITSSSKQKVSSVKSSKQDKSLSFYVKMKTYLVRRKTS